MPKYHMSELLGKVLHRVVGVKEGRETEGIGRSEGGRSGSGEGEGGMFTSSEYRASSA